MPNPKDHADPLRTRDPHDKSGHHGHEGHATPDEFTADLERDSKGRQSSSLGGLVREEEAPTTPVAETYIADPEAHHQHSRKGQAESPVERTLNQPEKKKH